MKGVVNRRLISALKRMQGLLCWLFAAQAQVVAHPAILKAVLTPRRAGKTELACIWLLDLALKRPGRKFLYVALSRPNAKDIAWEMLKRLCKKFSIEAHFHETDLEITLPNGAVIMLRGADQPKWVEKLEGQEFDLIVIDEGGLYSINLRKLVYGSFKPMVIGSGGSIIIIGRPGDVKHGLFWDITDPSLRTSMKPACGAWDVDDIDEGSTWAVFNWSTFDNPFMAKQWRKDIDERLAKNPKLIDDPKFRRHFLGEWCEDTEGSVYGGFDEGRNVIDEFIPMDGDQFGLATDFGWDDAQAMCVGCWNERRPDFLILESFKQKNMPLADALDRMEMYQLRYPGLKMWGDPARKQLYMEMAIRFGKCVNCAEKTDKHDYIDLMNNDYALGRIKIVRATNAPLLGELRNLKRLIKEDGTWVEHPKQPNDCCDTSLYVWRHGHHFRYKAPDVGPAPGTPAFAELEAKAMWDAERDRAAAKSRSDWWRQ